MQMWSLGYSIAIRISGLHDNDVLESILEGRETRLFARRRSSHTERRLRGKDLGPGHVLRERQEQVTIAVNKYMKSP